MVTHRLGVARQQTSIFCLEDFIASDNMVRVIDAFVDILDFESLGFAHVKGNKTGAPAFHPAILMRIYLYGYLNRVRSSRKLEKECERNLEMRWLTYEQTPCYHTISTFRTYKKDIFDENKEKIGEINHRKALKEVFRSLNRFLNGEGLFGKETVASDGTKIRAQNAKKKNYTLDKLEKKIALGDAEIEKYLSEIDQTDAAEKHNPLDLNLEEKQEKLAELQLWNTKYKGYKAELERRQAIDPEITQISLTDPEARSIVINNSGHSEVAYNIVTAVDDKHKLVADFLVENIKDTTLLAQSMIACKVEFDNDFAANLHQNSTENNEDNTSENEEKSDIKSKLNKDTTLNGLADKGFHSASGLQECIENGIITYVAVPQPAFSGKDKDFTVVNFEYQKQSDTYVCPNKKTLITNGSFYEKKDRKGQIAHRFKRYKISFSECNECPFKEKCLSKSNQEQSHGRNIERMECQDASDENKARVSTAEGKILYKKRQGIVEHPFGTIKRQWDCSYTLVRGKEKVIGEFAIVWTCYNLRRAMSILPVNVLLQRLKAAKNSISSFFSCLYEPFYTIQLAHIIFLLYFCKRRLNRS